MLIAISNEPGVEEEWNRGVNMGHGLERINRSRRGKLPVVIPQGHIRPLVPIIAAKYATECNIAVRSHVPVLTHWKKYKAKENRAVIARYLGTLQVSTFSKAFLFRCNKTCCFCEVYYVSLVPGIS